MCGIIGYVGGRPCQELILDGLQHLEYRGYDSAGIALVEGDGVHTVRAVIDPLGRVTKSLPLGAEGVMDAALPRRIEPTLYARTGDAGIAVVIGAGLILIVRRRARRA